MKYTFISLGILGALSMMVYVSGGAQSFMANILSTQGSHEEVIDVNAMRGAAQNSAATAEIAPEKSVPKKTAQKKTTTAKKSAPVRSMSEAKQEKIVVSSSMPKSALPANIPKVITPSASTISVVPPVSHPAPIIPIVPAVPHPTSATPVAPTVPPPASIIPATPTSTPSSPINPSASTTSPLTNAIGASTTQYSVDAPIATSSSVVTTPTSSPATMGVVLISEVMTGRKGDADYDFIELYNTGGTPIVLTGWTIKKRTSTGNEDGLVAAARLKDRSIPGYGYLLLANEIGYTGTPAADIVWPGSYSLAAEKNSIALYKTGGVVADETAWTAIPDGQSIVRDSWGVSSFHVVATPTPRSANVQ